MSSIVITMAVLLVIVSPLSGRRHRPPAAAKILPEQAPRQRCAATALGPSPEPRDGCMLQAEIEWDAPDASITFGFRLAKQHVCVSTVGPSVRGPTSNFPSPVLVPRACSDHDPRVLAWRSRPR